MEARDRPLRTTSSSSPPDASKKERSGIPFSCVVQPLSDGTTAVSERRCAESLPRCERCLAYACRYCTYDRMGWTCSLCGHFSRYESEKQKTLYAKASSRCALEETTHSDVRFAYSDGRMEEGGNGSGRREACPCMVSLVDVSEDGGTEAEKLESVKMALDVAMEASSPGTRFGLATFSRDVRLLDARSKIHAVRRVSLERNGYEPSKVQLSDVMPVEEFLVALEDRRSTLSEALDAIEVDQACTRENVLDPNSSDPEATTDVSLGRNRDFGGALECMIDYLSEREQDGVAKPILRLMCFLSGPVHLGRGMVGTWDHNTNGRRRMNVEEEIDKSLTEATGFYRAEAVKAAARGIVIDLYIFSEHFVDLASMHYLATLTGGSIHLYPDIRHSSLPQDVHRHIASPQAFLANMRVRTSPDFRVCRCYGKLLEDEQYENLQHIVVCNKLDTFVLDFEHTAGQGFEEDIEWPPMLQLAFQYYTIEQSPVKDRDGNRVVTHSLVRYLRIVTLPWKVSESPKHLQNAVDAEAVICVLMHKVAEALRLDGIAEARLLLQDWLIILVSRYNEAFGLATCGGIDESQSIDVTFQSCYALSTIPRMIYALLRSPLLSTDINNTHPDMRMFQLCLYSVLPPALLRKALYPQLSTYSAEGVVDKMDLPLTRATLTLHPDRIFVLDAFTDIIIYYTPASEGLPFPPPRDSLIRKEAEGLKKHRNISPSLHMIMGGKDVTEIFDRYMIEDEGGGLVKNKDLSNMGYASFMSFIETEVRVYMT